MDEILKIQFDKIDNYFFIIQCLAERANDEFSIAIKQVCQDAMKYSWSVQKAFELENNKPGA